MQISTKIAKYSMVNIHIDPDFSFHLKISDILKPDVILKKSNSNWTMIANKVNMDFTLEIRSALVSKSQYNLNQQ